MVGPRPVEPESPDYADVAAEFYDALRGHDPLPGEYEFYARELARIPGPHLEIGCGTGRILLRLLQAGIEAEGLDCSADMLLICREKAAALGLSPTLHHRAMQDMAPAARYGAIFAPLATMMLLEDRREVLAALAAFRRQLRPGGRLFFSTFRRPGGLTGSPWRLVGALAARGGSVRVWQALDVEPGGDAVVERFRFDGEGEGGPLGPVHRIRLRFWEAAEMTALLEASGYDEVAVTADHRDAAPTADTPVLMFRSRSP
jgi:SAM-dependent methyltransferase